MRLNALALVLGLSHDNDCLAAMSLPVKSRLASICVRERFGKDGFELDEKSKLHYSPNVHVKKSLPSSAGLWVESKTGP